MPISEEDLQKKRDKAEKLREQIAEAEATAAANSQNAVNEIEAKQLDAETARLETRLAQAKAAAKVSAAKEGAAGPLAQVTEQLEAANAAKSAAADSATDKKKE